MDNERSESFYTKCKPCVFNESENGKQVGCQLNRLEKFKSINKAILDDDDYYTIKTICNTCRGENWKEQNNSFNLLTKVEDEIKIPLDFILLNIDKTEDVFDEIIESVNLCLNQKHIKPKKIIIVIRNRKIDYSELYNIIREICGETKFKIVKIISNDSTILECIDMGAQKSSSRYYAVFDTAHVIPTNLISALNDLINYQLKSVSMIAPYKNYNGLILQTMLHRIFGGNRVMPVYEKILEAAEIQGSQDNIYTWEDLWKTPE